MAHWAELDENNIVLRVLVGDNNDPNGDEGYQWLLDNLGGRWVKTSYNSRGGIHTIWGMCETLDKDGNIITFEGYANSSKPHLRYNFAGVGYIYDPIRDAFIPPKPEVGEWVLNEDTCLWESIIK